MLSRPPWLGQRTQFDKLKRREFITLLGATGRSSRRYRWSDF
jgi:hypothetical protein